MSRCSFYEDVCVVFAWEVSCQFIRHWFLVRVGLASLWNGSGLWWFGFVEVVLGDTGVYRRTLNFFVEVVSDSGRLVPD
jgi:hypothetical protein